MCLPRNDNQNLVLNLNRSRYKSQYGVIVNTTDNNKPSSTQLPYINSAKEIECQNKTPIVEILHRDCVICYLTQKREKTHLVNDKKVAFASVLGNIATVCYAIASLIVAISAIAVVSTPIFVALFSITSVIGVFSLSIGAATLANRFLLKNEEAKIDVSIIIESFLKAILLHIDAPKGVQKLEVLQTNKKELGKLIREDQCAGAISKLRQLYHKLDNLERQQKQLCARIDSETSPQKKEKYEYKLSEIRNTIELSCNSVKILSEKLHEKIFSSVESMCHADYKEEFLNIKRQYILKLLNEEVLSGANLYGLIFIEQDVNQETIMQFYDSEFFKALLSGISLIEEKMLFMGLN